MPVTRAINGHGPTVRPVVDYLTRDGRAVAADFLNCLEVERHGRPVWQQMDECRRAMGCDAPWPGHERARTWEHIVVSPDPADCCDLETLRDLATSWARRYLGGYQVAIYYHDDNALRIPHAHLVVNNASLDRPGGRLSTELTHERWREMFCGLQDMARERGLSALELLPEGARRTGGTVQRTYRTSRDIELEARDASWKRDVRDRMACAVRLSGGEGEYLEACRALGLTVRESRGRDFDGEWVYGHPGAGREVAGPTLGRDWSRTGIGRRIARDGLAGVTKPSGPGREALLAAMAGLSSPDGTMALQVIGTTRGTPVTAGQVSGMLDVCRDS